MGNNALKIIKITTNDDRPLDFPKGCKVSDKVCRDLAKKYGVINCYVHDDKNRINDCRVVIYHNPNENSQESFMYLITNLPNLTISAKQVYAIYRLRWQIENESFKVLKQCCGFNKINSGKINVNLFNILSSLCVNQIMTSLFIDASIKQYNHQSTEKEFNKLIDILQKAVLGYEVPEKIDVPPMLSFQKAFSGSWIRSCYKKFFNSKKKNKREFSKFTKIIVNHILKYCYLDKTLSKEKLLKSKDIRISLLMVSIP